MFIAVTLAIIVLAAIILENLPGASHAVFDAELGLCPRAAHGEAYDYPGGHVVCLARPAAPKCAPLRPTAAS